MQFKYFQISIQFTWKSGGVIIFVWFKNVNCMEVKIVEIYESPEVMSFTLVNEGVLCFSNEEVQFEDWN